MLNLALNCDNDDWSNWYLGNACHLSMRMFGLVTCDDHGVLKLEIVMCWKSNFINRITMQILFKLEYAQRKLKYDNSINNFIETNKVDVINILPYKNFLNINYHIIEIVRIKTLYHKFS